MYDRNQTVVAMGRGREKDFSGVTGMFYSLFETAITQVHQILKPDSFDHLGII